MAKPTLGRNDDTLRIVSRLRASEHARNAACGIIDAWKLQLAYFACAWQV